MKFYKTFPILLAISLLVVGGANYFIVPASPVDECERVFSSNVYSDYLGQLKAFLQMHPLAAQVKEGPDSPLNLQMKKLIDVVEAPRSPKDEMRKIHETFVRELRHAVSLSSQSQTQNEKESAELLNDLVRWIYLGAGLNQSMEEFLFAYVPAPHGSLPSYLAAMQTKLHDDKRFKGLKYEPEEEDGYLHGNLPSVYATLPTPQRTKLIRAGRPFVQSLRFPWSSPELSPEFAAFLKKSPGHFYVNLLKRQGSESKTTKAIENLEKQFPDIFVITLDKNSDFYIQDIKKYPAAIDAESFKVQFLQQLLAPKGNYYWSSHLENESWHEELKGILNRVQEDYFFEKADLDPSERRDFIELAYLEILDLLLDKWNPPSMNFSCHQGMDRGPSLLVLWLQKRDQINERETAALLLAPPLLFHNRSSHAQRILRFASALQRLDAKEEISLSEIDGKRE